MRRLYSDLKIFYFPSKLRSLSSRSPSAPLHVRIKPTNRCNHRCFYCCYRNNNLHSNELFNEKDEIPQGKMIEIIKDLAHMGIKAVTFSGGGEPLCYPYISESIEGFAKAGIKIGVLTNGSLLSGRIAEILGAHASWIRISIDSVDAKTYARTRSVSLNEFDALYRNISDFAKQKFRHCQLGINFIVTRNNFSDVYKFLKQMKGLGVNHVKISECVVSTEEKVNKKYLSSVSDSVREQITQAISNLVDDRFMIIDKFNNFCDKESNYKKYYTKCPFIQCLSVIAADMNVYMCQDKAYTTRGKLGSIKRKNFQKLWFESKTKSKLLKLNPQLECKHHCTQHAKNISLLNYLEIYEPHAEFV